MSVGEDHSLSAESINVRRGNFALRIVDADIAYAKIIAEDIDDVGLVRSTCD